MWSLQQGAKFQLKISIFRTQDKGKIKYWDEQPTLPYQDLKIISKAT